MPTGPRVCDLPSRLEPGAGVVERSAAGLEGSAARAETERERLPDRWRCTWGKKRAPSGGGEGGPSCPPGTRGGLEASGGAPPHPELPRERWRSPGAPGLKRGAPERTGAAGQVRRPRSNRHKLDYSTYDKQETRPSIGQHDDKSSDAVLEEMHKEGQGWFTVLPGSTIIGPYARVKGV
ncbi:hypothetical protein NDU88_005107 [Pleurodeles waltl]|uniref:Uncharacterized protein n=1 Tax=Pleurodeles waltl TaxID=8319 RepID=A0AAV7LSW7_PLEWA|nr:hypothetical protein NDU88_005107 [Pleurodeles waltl]